MNTLLCVIAKNENLYIREFVEHYFNIGFTNIVLYDNNDIEGENLNDVIKDYIDSGFVKLINIRGKKTIDKTHKLQLMVYNACYFEYSKDYDWIAFFDTDEYLVLPDQVKSVSEWLKSPKFANFGSIQINWKCFGDNGLLHYENKPLNERFKKPCGGDNFYDFPDNCLRKTIIRTKIPYVNWMLTPHAPLTSVIACNANGKLLKDSLQLLVYPEYENTAYIKHFITKTIEEYVLIKMKRGYPDMTDDEAKKVLELKDFFNKNEYTEEKMELAKKLIENGKQL